MHRGDELQIDDLAELFQLNADLRRPVKPTMRMVEGGVANRGRAFVIALATKIMQPFAMLFLRRQHRINHLLIYTLARNAFLDRRVEALNARLQKLEQDLEATKKN